VQTPLPRNREFEKLREALEDGLYWPEGEEWDPDDVSTLHQTEPLYFIKLSPFSRRE